MEKRPDAGEALVSFGIASAVRDVAISVASVLSLLYLFPLLGLDISGPGWHRHPPHSTPVPSSWAGPGVLAACVAVAFLVGGLLLRLRDD